MSARAPAAAAPRSGAGVAAVDTAADLRAAVARGAPHIEIRRHLDLRSGGGGNAPSSAALSLSLPDFLAIRVRAPGRE